MTLKIKEARKLAGITQKELAKQIGVSAGTLSDYESGNHEPKSDVLCSIADICGVTIDFLVGRAKEKAPAPSEDSTRAISVEALEAMLIQGGFIRPGEDLSDDDLDFLLSVGRIVETWFRKRQKHGGE